MSEWNGFVTGLEYYDPREERSNDESRDRDNDSDTRPNGSV